MFQVIYENKNILAIEKPEGIATIPGFDTSGDNVYNRLKETGYKELFVVHRLDKAVSGILIFAKNKKFHRYLNTLFEKRLITKHYLAIVSGFLDKKTGIIDAPIRRYGSGRMGVDFKKGKQSLTRYKVILSTRDWSLLMVSPVTGRRHQIRVHLYHIGHPVIGDPLYGNIKKNLSYPRLMLHAHRIKIPLPDGSILSLKSSLPLSFRGMLKNRKSVTPYKQGEKS